MRGGGCSGSLAGSGDGIYVLLPGKTAANSKKDSRKHLKRKRNGSHFASFHFEAKFYF
jgi:hypothetical protein